MSIRVISLGAGVQSTTMALMAAHGEIGPMPDCAIFADTGWEPKAVYDHLNWLKSGNVLPFPVHIVSAGDLRADALTRSNTTGQKFAAIPWHVRSEDGKRGMARRQCTKEYKLRPIQKKVVELLGGKRTRGGATLWIGISLDEAIRMKPSRVQYIVNRHPLIEKMMNRFDCLAWLKRHHYPRPPRSACIGCPYNSNARWRSLSKEELADAVEVDRAIRTQSGFRGEQFAHRDCIPLEEVDFRKKTGDGFFNDECEGMCGV
jgi:hypothetical protein